MNFEQTISYISVFALSVCFNYGLNKLYRKFRLHDAISNRSSHVGFPTRTGGLAIFLSLLIYYIISFFTDNKIYPPILCALAFIIISILGFLDDLYDLNHKIKLVIQLICGGLIIYGGSYIESFFGVFGITELPYVVSVGVTLFVFIVIINAVNLVDGIDSLSSQLFIIPTGVIAYLLFESNVLLPKLFGLYLTAIIAYLIFNLRKKNKVFLGDTGSLLLGSTLAYFIFLLLDNDISIITDSKINRGYLSVLLILYPLSDTLRVFSLRIKNRTSPFIADRNHLHHKLIDKGYSHVLASLVITTLSSLIVVINLIWFNYLGLLFAPLLTLLFLYVIFIKVFK